MLKNAVAYYRTESTKNLEFASEAAALQSSTVREWMEVNREFRLIAEKFDNYNPYKGRKDALHGLRGAIEICRENGATLVYPKVKLWRPNEFIDMVIMDFVEAGGSAYEIPSEEVERIMIYFRKKSAEKREALAQKREALRRRRWLQPVQERGRTAQKIKRLRHLSEIFPIIAEFTEMAFSPEDGAHRLNFIGFTTSSGKEWTGSNYRKVQKNIMKWGLAEELSREINELEKQLCGPVAV